MKIGIVGSGFVGSTAAYALIMQGVGREIVLVDKNADRADAEAMDLRHAIPFAHPLQVKSGGYPELKGSGIVILSAGVSQKPGESRLALLKRNASVFREILPNVLEQAPEAILVVATNPLDIMTQMAADCAGEFGVEAGRVLGTGTMLDTARYRALLGGWMGVDPYHVHAYVVGEHGDTEVLTWSLATVGGMHLEDFCRRRGLRFDDALRVSIEDQVQNAAYHIIREKGATYYGIGSALAKLVDVIFHDQRSILTVCSPANDVEGVSGVSISLPRLVGGGGVLTTLSLPLAESEAEALRLSAQKVKESMEELRRASNDGG